MTVLLKSKSISKNGIGPFLFQHFFTFSYHCRMAAVGLGVVVSSGHIVAVPVVSLHVYHPKKCAQWTMGRQSSFEVVCGHACFVKTPAMPMMVTL
jgi:hypothetical protein